MGVIDIMKKAGDAAKTAIDYGARSAIPEYNDVRELQAVDQQTQQAPISILDPSRQPALKTQRGQELYAGKQQSIKEQAKGLMQAALYADDDQALQIAAQLDTLYGKKDYFTKLLKDADERTNKSLGLDAQGLPKQGGEMSKAKGRAIMMSTDPTAARLNVGSSILDAQKGIMEKGAEADINIGQKQRELPIEQKKKVSDTDEAIRAAKAATNEAIRQSKAETDYGLDPNVVIKKAKANQDIEKGKQLGGTEGEIEAWQNAGVSAEDLKKTKTKGKETDPTIKAKRSLDTFKGILGKKTKTVFDPANPMESVNVTEPLTAHELQYYNQIWAPAFEKNNVLSYDPAWKPNVKKQPGGPGEKERAILDELRDLKRMKGQK